MRMKKKMVAAGTAVGALGIAALAGGFASSGTPAASVSGVWYGTGFVGDPDDPLTTIETAVTFHRDGTFQLDSTIETGEHPFFANGDDTPLHGIWWRDGQTIQARGFSFTEGERPPETFGVILNSAQFEFDGQDTLVGTFGSATHACPGGPEDCPDVTELDFPDPGPDVVILSRLQPDR